MGVYRFDEFLQIKIDYFRLFIMSEKRKRIKNKLVKKYRLVVLTNDSFEEKFSFKLTRLNVFVFGGFFSIVLIVFTAAFLIYTPLKQYIPGFESPELKKNVISLNIKLDSIEQNMHALELYTESMKPVLIGDKVIEMEPLPFVTKKGESVYQAGITNNDSTYVKLTKLYALLEERNNKIAQLKKEFKNRPLDSENYLKSSSETAVEEFGKEELVSLKTSVLDSVFREKVEMEERFSLFGHETNRDNQIFTTPVKGIVQQHFNAVENRFGIEISTAKNEPVKAVADGVVIFAEWSIETGYVVVLLHVNNYVSIYRYISKINISHGELVYAGQTIANVGFTSTETTKPRLHFEMWKEIYPVDPTNFMKF